MVILIPSRWSLERVVNAASGHTTYKSNGRRIAREVFNHLRERCTRQEAMQTVREKRVTRHYSVAVFE